MLNYTTVLYNIIYYIASISKMNYSIINYVFKREKNENTSFFADYY